MADYARLRPKSVAFASAAVWGMAVLFVGVVNMLSPGYGQAFLDLVRSIYPGYKAEPNLVSVVIGVLYAILDGAVGGLIFAWLYNCCACKKSSR